jgi:hypothetical protein
MSKQRLGAMLVVGVVGLAMLAGIIWLIWCGMLLVPANTARLWALLATALLPVVAWAGWYFGHTEARGRLAGIDQAVDKVMGAATRAAGLQVSAARAMRRSAPEPPIVVLPDVEIVPRQLQSGGDIIEL